MAGFPLIMRVSGKMLHSWTGSNRLLVASSGSRQNSHLNFARVEWIQKHVQSISTIVHGVHRGLRVCIVTSAAPLLGRPLLADVHGPVRHLP